MKRRGRRHAGFEEACRPGVNPPHSDREGRGDVCVGERPGRRGRLEVGSGRGRGDKRNIDQFVPTVVIGQFKQVQVTL